MIIEIIFTIVLILILIAFLVTSNIAKSIKNEENSTGLSGFEIAKKIAVNEPHIIKKNGKYVDHYNSERNVIKLSASVFDGTSVYAALIAFAIALETRPENIKYAKGHKMSGFIVLSSYILIILGAFLNNTSIIHFGMILFIIAFVLEFILLGICIPDKKNDNALFDILKEAEVLEPIEDFHDLEVFGFFTYLAYLPFKFIYYFK